MKFEIPFHFEEEFIDFVNKNKKHIRSVFYSGPKSLFGNARHLKIESENINELMQSLKKIDSSIKKYITINGVFSPNEVYDSEEKINDIISFINLFYKQGQLDGIILFDMYLFSILANKDNTLFNNLELIPSINYKIDSIDKFENYISQIKSIININFTPTTIILDRSLNRDFDKLSKISNHIQKKYPLTNIVLLANEGCINNCMFKNTHDAMVCFENVQKSIKKIDLVNKKYGCGKYISDEPWKLLTSPFIRPEDVKHFSDVCDTIKISGKNLKSEDIINIIQAYIYKSYKGNLLDLIEVFTKLHKSNIFLDNSLIDAGFFKKTTQCRNLCDTCSYCKEVFEKSIVTNKYNPNNF